MIDDLKRSVGWELAENVLDGVMLSAPDGRVFAANRAACALLGRTEEDIVAAGRAGVVAADDPNIDEALLERERAGAVSTDLRLVRGDGSVILAEVASQMFDGPDGEQLTMITFRDVTERRRLERELAESEERFRALSGASFEAVVVHVGGVLLDGNERFFELFDVGPEAFGTLRVRDVIAPSSRAAADAFIAEHGHGPLELELLRSDGTSFRAEVRARDALVRGAAARVVSIRDVEDRLHVEAERAEVAARAAEIERVQSLAVMAGGIAHEFNNLLHVAIAGIELATDPDTTPAETAQHLATVASSLTRAAELSKAMLAYSGHQAVVRDWVDLAEIASAAAARFPRGSPQVEIEERPRVRADADAIAGVVSVLLANAADADPSGGAIRVRVGGVELAAEDAVAVYPTGEVDAGRYAFVEVSDEGEGMDEATRARMFDPFFSTRFPGRGLGLAAALGVVRGHGGGFVVRSEPGHGTAVRLLLPAGS